MTVSILHGDAIELLATLDDASIDAVVTDPPYGLEFMNRAWDSFKPANARLRTRIDGRTNPREGKSVTVTPEAYVAGAPYQEFSRTWAAECLRVLKPGGHLLAFGGTRTYHRLASGIEDAGFDIRDSITWLYGSGFPKSMDVSKAIDKAAGAERAVTGPSARHGGGSNAVYARDSWTQANQASMGATITAPATDEWDGWGTALKPASEPIIVARKPFAGTVVSNVLTHGTGALNIDGCRAGTDSTRRTQRGTTQAWEGGVFSGERTNGSDLGRWPANVVLSHNSDCNGTCTPGCNVETLGEPARFFPTFRYQAKAPSRERPKVDGVAHPTVKPLELMRWLVRLVTPPAGTVLDPFAGSGTTAHACQLEGFDCITIEREPTYLPLINARLGR